MKKNVKISIMIFLNLCCVGGLIWLASWVISVYKVETYRIDITQFSGRIIPADNIKPGTFTIKVPMAEALKYGKDAILSYGKEGVKIWTPDSCTGGVFRYSAIITNNPAIMVYKVFRNDKEIILRSSTPTFFYFASAFFLLVAIGINIMAIKFAIKVFKS